MREGSLLLSIDAFDSYRILIDIAMILEGRAFKDSHYGYRLSSAVRAVTDMGFR